MPFSPSDISGLKIWLKADAGSGSSDNDPVGTWTDQSGGSHNFTSSGGNRPLYKVGIRNGLPAILFDGSDDYLSGGDLSALFSTGASMFCAANVLTGDRYTIYEHGQIDMWWAFTSQNGYWGPFRSSRLSNTPGSGLPASGSGWHMWSLTANNGSNYKMYVDGTNQINDSAGFTFSGGTQHWLGQQHPAGNLANMYMGELIVYDSALNDTDRGNVEAYLTDRWITSKATPAAVAAVGTVPAITGSGTAFTLPAVVAGVGSVPAPTAKGNSIAVPSAVAGVGTVPAATASGTAFALPSVVAGIGAVPAPTAVGATAGVATPSAVAGVGSVPAPTATGNSTALPAAVAGVGAVPAPTAKGNSAAVPSTVVGIGAVPAPTASGVQMALPATVTAIGRVPFPTTEGEGTGGGGGSVDGANDFWSIVLAS